MSFDRGDSTAIAGKTSVLAIEAGGTNASTANDAINNLLPDQENNADKYLKTDGTNTSWDAISVTAGNLTGTVAIANGGTGATDASTARTNLGLGTAATTDSTAYAPAAKGVTNGDSHDHSGGDGSQIAYGTLSGLPTLGTISSQNANNVSITGGSVTGITDLAVADGGTGASTAQNARINLLPSYTGNANKVLAVNSGTTDVEWVAAGTGNVTGVTATSPVASSGGTAPVISLNSAYGDTLNPYGSKTANFVLASPNGSAGVPTFRAIVAADIPTLNQNTTGTASNVTGTVAVANGGTGSTTLTANNVILGNGTSAVTFVAPGTSGNVLTSNGTTWTSAAASSGTPASNTYDTGTSVTWTKPASANWVLIELWGGGGSGAKGTSNGPGGGGGGGAYNSFLFKFSDLVGNVTYNVGGGGLSQTTATTAGNAGGNTTVLLDNFASSGTTKTLTAYGGGGGLYQGTGGSGGGGGGQLGAGRANVVILGTNTTTNIRFASYHSESNGGAPFESLPPWNDGACTPTYYLFPAYNGGGCGGVSSQTTTILATQGSASYFGGGGGGAGIDGTPTNTTTNRGGDSVYGGAGGGGAGNSTRAGDGGTSIFGGNGGAGAFDANNSTAGTTPGGGSGGTEGGNSGAGGSGRVRFTYW